MNGAKNLLRGLADRAPYILLGIGFALSGYWVWLSCLPAITDRPVTLDFMWPTFTPQKVRYGEYLARRYMEEHPDVHVNLILTPDPYRKLQVMIAGRTAPDVVWLGVGWEQFGPALYTLDDFIAADPAVSPDDYFPELWSACQWRGQAKALPSSGQVSVMYYNKDMFDQAGVPYPEDDWTWDDMVAKARVLTRDYDRDGMVDQYGVQLEQVYRIPFLLYAGQLANEDWTKAQIDNPLTVEILRRYRDLMLVERVMPSMAASVELGIPIFENGQVAMFAASGWALEAFRKVKFDWDIAPLPYFEFEGKRYRATGRWQEEFAMVWNTELPERSWDFIKWCAGREMVAWAARAGHIVPGRPDVAYSADFLDPKKRPANLKAFIDSIPFSLPVLPHAAWKRISLEFDSIWLMYLQGADGRFLSPEECAQRLDMALQSILDEFNAEEDRW